MPILISVDYCPYGDNPKVTVDGIAVSNIPGKAWSSNRIQEIYEHRWEGIIDLISSGGKVTAQLFVLKPTDTDPVYKKQFVRNLTKSEVCRVKAYLNEVTTEILQTVTKLQIFKGMC